MLQVVKTYREFREFLAAKERKREGIRWKAHAPSEATYVPKGAQGFARFRAVLRDVSDWAAASEHVDSLAAALRRRHQCDLPLPRKVVQNTDCSLTVFWEALTVRAFPDGLVSIVGGTTGAPIKGATNEILDMLAFQARLQ